MLRQLCTSLRYPVSIDHFLQVFLHLDHYIQALTIQLGPWMYGLLFGIIFIETGLIVWPFLPGDSLLFAAGSISAISDLNVHYLAILLTIAAILGDTLNYALGKWLGPKVFNKQQSLFFNKQYLTKAHAFYEKYGAKTIVLARFIPIIRSFAPFVAGIGKMKYGKFLTYNIFGAIAWIYSFLYISHWFGNLPIIKNNFSLIVIGIIVVSLLPPCIELILQRKQVAKD